MLKQVEIDDGCILSVHTRIKDMCKAARNRLGLTNQDIADAISERYALEDFSVNTVNNFFSERSKAATIYTAGCICAVLEISIDAVFGIEHTFSTAEEVEFVQQMAQLKVENRLLEQKLEDMNKTMEEKDKRIDQAHEALEFYRLGAQKSSRNVQPWILNVVLCVLSIALIIIGILLFKR